MGISTIWHSDSVSAVGGAEGAMKIYISGKIGDLDMEIVRTKFDEAEISLLELGHLAVNPLDIHDERSPIIEPSNWNEYMLNDIAAIFDCDGIYMLPCWQESPGARIEHAICKEMGKKIFYAETVI